MTKKVFISHSSKDSKTATAICTALEARGHECWMSSRDIKPGENFQGTIVRAIRDSGVMVLVFSANANNSDEIKKEMALASQSKKMVIPVRAEDVLPSEDFTYELATRQWIDGGPDNRWFIQLTAGSASEMAGVGNYLARADQLLEPGRAGLYLAENGREARIGVIYGDFPSRKAASQAIEQLPDELRRQRPFARKVAWLK